MDTLTEPQTTEQVARIQRDWDSIAKEGVSVEKITSAFYGFGSELATLRLLAKYRDCKKATQGYSENRKSFYFCLEVSF